MSPAPTKRSLSRRVSGLDTDGEYPTAGLITVLSASTDPDPVDPARDLWRIDGTVYRVQIAPGVRDRLRGSESA